MTKELNQFNKYKAFETKHANDLSKEDRKKKLHCYFSEKKKSGAVKARSGANRSVQREHVVKEAAPTVGLNSVFITSAIDAKESRKVETIDIPGAFLHADNEDYLIMKMVGTLAELMVKSNPVISTVCDTRERKIRALSTTTEGAIWHGE